MTFVHIYLAISILVGFVDIGIACMCFFKNNKLGKYLGFTSVAAALVDVTYILSVVSTNEMLISVFSSMYFMSVDFLVNALLLFVLAFTRHRITKLSRTLVKISMWFMTFEYIVFIINPFYHISISYSYRNTIIACYQYDMGFLYYCHLGYTYVLIAAVILLLIDKMLKVASEYAMQYLFSAAAIIAIVGINFIFLFMPDLGAISLLDYSILCYGIAIAFLYWCTFEYYRKGMMTNLKTNIFENIDKGIVLFDYDDRMTLFNSRAKSLLSGVNMGESTLLEDFLDRCGIQLNEKNHMYSMQCYVNGEEDSPRPLRCDYRYIKSKNGKNLGRLFVFSDAIMDTDLLTGFHNWDSFQQLVADNPNNFSYPVSIALCDITGLSVVNATYGRSAGDKLVRELAENMKAVFPFDSFFVRGHDTNLIAICHGNSESMMESYADHVVKAFSGQMIYAVGTAESRMETILSVIQKTNQGLKTRKLLNKESIHSSVLNSLMSALKETDADTEAHVKRTQLLGETLGKRLNLSQNQQSELALLCIMHDIGKIGIPLEILNKPGKLSEGEWRLMQSHVEKGHQIALSSDELSGIADAVLHHHERWDGKGYPSGLSKESIPILSRIISVIDSYDAMVSNRPYKNALSKNKAKAELKRFAGAQFDPMIVSEFIRMLEENEDAFYEGADSHPAADPGKTAAAQPLDGYVARRQLESEAQEENLQADLTHAFPFSRYILDASGQIIQVDENFEAFTGYTADEIYQGTLGQLDLIPKSGRMEYLVKVNEQLGNNHNAFMEHVLKTKNGSEKYVFCYGRQYYDSVAKDTKSEIVIADSASSYIAKMMAKKEQEKAAVRLDQWENTYRRDSLTGLLNHAGFVSDVELKILNPAVKVVLLMMDVDRFKEYNDTYGHRAGDEFLIFIAETLESILRKGDQACRMGGDEFAVALYFDQNTENKSIHNRVREIYDTLSMLIASSPKSASLSMGVAIEDERLNSFNKLYDASDKALYLSKKRGRGMVSINADEGKRGMFHD